MWRSEDFRLDIRLGFGMLFNMWQDVDLNVLPEVPYIDIDLVSLDLYEEELLSDRVTALGQTETFTGEIVLIPGCGVQQTASVQGSAYLPMDYLCVDECDACAVSVLVFSQSGGEEEDIIDD